MNKRREEGTVVLENSKKLAERERERKVRKMKESGGIYINLSF